ncbi:hypothetical protein [Pseudothermotoga sp.]|uniref:hypothetical protein n=1 Tax=Pseudothermotoga sp. TaxID=2033661 RepID=UPI0031F63744
MKIENYHVSMSSVRSYEHLSEKQERIRIVRVVQTEPVRLESTKFEIKLSEKDRLKLMLIKALLEKLTGRKVRLIILESSESKELSIAEPGRIRTQMGFIYEKNEYQRESETTNFSAKGYIETKDGRRIEFEVNFQLSRLYESRQNLRLAVGALQDPIVLKLDDAPIGPFEKKLQLDLDLDGESEEFFLPKNVALLVLDSNDNGKLDDGRELFGPLTGKGFLELSRYDDDGNSWIDESDIVFAKLKILKTDGNGLKLLSLSEVNVGAIYLGFVRTQFNFYDGGTLLGRLNSTGIYLTEDGQVRTVHQLDLKI